MPCLFGILLSGETRETPLPSQNHDFDTSEDIRSRAYCLLNSALIPKEDTQHDNLEPVLSKMQKDETFRHIEVDFLIKRFGLVLLTKFVVHRISNIGQCIRQLARL